MTRTKFLFKEEFPSRIKRYIGEVRPIDGQHAFYHDQMNGRTDTRIRKYPCPMTIPRIIVPDLIELKVTDVFVRPTKETLLYKLSLAEILETPVHKLGCEPQYFPDWSLWSVTNMNSIYFPPAPVDEWKVYTFPVGSLMSKWERMKAMGI